MDLVNNIRILQRYYNHPFKEISPNAIMVTDASEISYHIEQEKHVSQGLHDLFVPRKKDIQIGFNSNEIVKNHRSLFTVYSNAKVDIVVFIEKNNLVENDTYMLFKKCSLYTVFRSSEFNRIYNDDNTYTKVKRYESDKQYISGRAEELIITQVNS